MSFANSKDRRVRPSIPRHGRNGGRSPHERCSDCWPDFSTEFSENEVNIRQRENKPGIVLKEAAAASLYAVGLVILLMGILRMLHGM
jgi:hypothetical protein